MTRYRWAKGPVCTIGCLIVFSACDNSTPMGSMCQTCKSDTISDTSDFQNSTGTEWQELIASSDDTPDLTDTSTDFQNSTGTEWQELIGSSDDTPDLTDAWVHVYIPDGVNKVRGVLIFSHNGVGEWEYEHEVWRTSAATQGYALMKITMGDIYGRVTPWEFPEQSARFIYRIFETTAQLTGRTELESSPFFFFGHSAGGFWFTRLAPQLSERTAGFIAFHGALPCDELFYPPALSIPGLFLIAEYDPIWIRDDTSEIVSTGLEKGALWSLVVEPDAGHWDIDPGRQLMVEFVETVFHHRVASTADADETKTALLDFPEGDIWLGQLKHDSVYDGNEEFEGSGREVITHASISPPHAETKSSSVGNRLLSRAFAESWLAYELSGICN